MLHKFCAGGIDSRRKIKVKFALFSVGIHRFAMERKGVKNKVRVI